MAGEDFTGPSVLNFQRSANSFRKLTGAAPSKAGSPRNIGQSDPGAPRAGSRDNNAASSVAGRVPEQWQCIRLNKRVRRLPLQPMPAPPVWQTNNTYTYYLAGLHQAPRFLPLPHRMGERAGERRSVFIGFPSPRSSPHSFLTEDGELDAALMIWAHAFGNDP